MLFLLTLLTSIVIASFLGHLTHWAIHQRWSGPAHRGHMDHHLKQYPPTSLTSMGKYKSAKWYHSGPFLFTPVFLIILAAAGGLAYTLEVPLWAVATLGVTLLTYGLGNDWVHDTFHVQDHWLSQFSWYRRKREEHYVHHRNMRRNFGIVSFTWDRVFGTYKEQ